ncbi:mechanosensitive ion channel protein 1, mitochondrial-like [Selaginella moellendorffii]|uniref:mechanosensitive ion channel protein 1, mitochondrial-like n=1 Tax=Selaginella moellendorffii TaxID=88036 RepID=UPI000D1CFA51|nr:mechanosensitive ion channel protein 1, mitochondrial-like [Selaginella moellendorffii]|eukprot:XP_024514918.1 mechanosensitive ion channel protein 1, mitochondrial-like [Selaginella moellendorffii]
MVLGCQTKGQVTAMSRRTMLHAAVMRYLSNVTSGASSPSPSSISGSFRKSSRSLAGLPGSSPRVLGASSGLSTVSPWSFGLLGIEQRRHFAASSAPDTPAASDPEVPASVISSTSKELWESVKEMSAEASNYTKQTVIPSLQQWLDPTSPYTMQGLIPTTLALASCAAAWLVLPRVLRRLHKYVEEGPTTSLLGKSEKHPYEMSMWAALEDPTRLFLTLVAFSQLGALVAPTTVVSHLELAWRGGLLLSGLWFLHRWKSVFFSRLLVGKASSKEELERYLVLDKVSSIGIIVLGAMALAEASGVPLQSVLTVGGIGGIATAFAARDVLGNALSGIILQFIKPFSVGDYITAGNIDGQIVKMGLHSTTLLNTDKIPMMVPNSFFSSQVIVNKSRCPKQAIKSRIYIRCSDIDKVPVITDEVVELLKTHPKILSEQDSPLCYLSKTAPTHLELTFSCDIQSLNKREVLALEQELLVRAAEVVRKSGAALGAPA